MYVCIEAAWILLTSSLEIVMTPIVVFKKELTYPPPPYSLSPATGEAKRVGEGKRKNGRGGEEWQGEQSKHNIKRLIKNEL